MERSSVEPRPSKSRDGIPAPLSPRGVNLSVEAGRSRAHLYPMTLAYVTGGLGLVLWSLPLA